MDEKIHDFIPVNTPLLNGNELKYLSECIQSGWISSEGPYVKSFENEFSTLVGRKYGIAVSNGSSALDAAVKAIGIRTGDEVIMPAFTIISCAAAIVRCGGMPVLVDADPYTWNMNTSDVEKKITKNTKAIMAVHIYGLPIDLDPLINIANKYHLLIIEDAAESHGQTYKGKPCGSFGDISTFSFYPNKVITTGEGGMIVTNDEILAEHCRSLRNLCFDKERRYIHEDLGWNLRMTNLQASIGMAQLERYNEFILRKRQIGKKYYQLLNEVPGIQLPVTNTSYAENIYWVYGIVLEDILNMNAMEFMYKLQAKNIQTRHFFYPMHLQPVFTKMGLFVGEHFPISEKLSERGFYLPSGLGLSDEDIEYVTECIKEVINDR
jgi:perosamine synthetase